MITLSLITINYRSESVLRRLVESACTLQDLPPTEWIIVNHTPDDPDLDKRLVCPASIASLKVLEYPQNKGFGDGCNLGAKNSSGEFLFFLNPDCLFRGGSLSALISRLQSDETIAALSPRLQNPQGRLEFSFDRFPGIFSEARLKIEKHLSRTFPLAQRAINRRFDKFRWTDWVTGGAMLVRRTAFVQVGGFDDGFFLYFEDTDLCRRLHLAEFRIGFDPSFSLIHDHGQGGSAQTSRGKPSVIYRQSQIRYYDKHKSQLSRLALRAYLHLTGRYPKLSKNS